MTARKTDAFISVADAMTKQALDVGIGKSEQFVTAYSAIEEDAFLQEPGDSAKKEFRAI